MYCLALTDARMAGKCLKPIRLLHFAPIPVCCFTQVHDAGKRPLVDIAEAQRFAPQHAIIAVSASSATARFQSASTRFIAAALLLETHEEFFQQICGNIFPVIGRGTNIVDGHDFGKQSIPPRWTISGVMM